MTVAATISLNSVRKTTAAVAQVFTDPPRVPAGEAEVLTYAARRDAAAALVVSTDFFPVFATSFP